MSLLKTELSSDSYQLLLLVAVLGGDMVPLDVLCRRSQQAQKRWAMNGQAFDLIPEAGLDDCIRHILPRSSELMAELSSYVTERMSGGFYSIGSPTREIWTQDASKNHEGLILQALRLICFVFPRERLWEQWYVRNSVYYPWTPSSTISVTIPCEYSLSPQKLC